MSLFSEAQVTAVIADYISLDAAHKLNMIGAALTSVPFEPARGFTSPLYLAVIVSVPQRHAGATWTLTISLRDHHGSAVMVPSGPGQSEALRVAQAVKAERPRLPGLHVPDEAMCQHISVLGFNDGLPLAVGGSYYWRVEVDGQTRPGWKASFFVPEPAQQPVFGGPAEKHDSTVHDPFADEADEYGGFSSGILAADDDDK